MTSGTFFFIFVPILALILLAVNLIFAPHNPYQEKDSTFECGFHSFLGQNRTQFSISFFIFALLFLLFDLEILLVYPYVVSAYTNDIYGLVIMLVFFLALTLGFAFELGKNALKIDSRQMVILNSKIENTAALLSVAIIYTSVRLALVNFYKNISLRYFGYIWITVLTSRFVCYLIYILPLTLLVYLGLILAGIIFEFVIFNKNIILKNINSVYVNFLTNKIYFITYYLISRLVTLLFLFTIMFILTTSGSFYVDSYLVPLLSFSPMLLIFEIINYLDSYIPIWHGTRPLGWTPPPAQRTHSNCPPPLPGERPPSPPKGPNPDNGIVMPSEDSNKKKRSFESYSSDYSGSMYNDQYSNIPVPSNEEIKGSVLRKLYLQERDEVNGYGYKEPICSKNYKNGQAIFNETEMKFVLDVVQQHRQNQAFLPRELEDKRKYKVAYIEYKPFDHYASIVEGPFTDKPVSAYQLEEIIRKVDPSKVNPWVRARGPNDMQNVMTSTPKESAYDPNSSTSNVSGYRASSYDISATNIASNPAYRPAVPVFSSASRDWVSTSSMAGPSSVSGDSASRSSVAVPSIVNPSVREKGANNMQGLMTSNQSMHTPTEANYGNRHPTFNPPYAPSGPSTRPNLPRAMESISNVQRATGTNNTNQYPINTSQHANNAQVYPSSTTPRVNNPSLERGSSTQSNSTSRQSEPENIYDADA